MHTCATHLLKNNAKLRHVQDILGHRSLATTERYLRLAITDLKEAHRGERRSALKLARRCRSLPPMSVAAEKIAEVLALPAADRAFLAHQLITSLDDTVDADAQAQWQEVLDRRSREIDEGKVNCRPVEEAVRDIRAKLDARRQPS